MMTEAGIIAALKHIINPILVGAIGLMGWGGRVLLGRVKKLEEQHAELDKQQAVQGSQLKEMRDDIHSIDKKLDKILDKILDDERRYGR
jgi:hypothetical protein